MGQLAMGAIHGGPAFGDVEDRGHLVGRQRMHRVPTRRAVDQRGGVAPPRPPAMHPRVRHLPQRARPGVGEPGGHGIVDGLQDGFLHLGGDPRRHRPT
jgi:hypothetical protein